MRWDARRALRRRRLCGWPRSDAGPHSAGSSAVAMPRAVAALEEKSGAAMDRGGAPTKAIVGACLGVPSRLQLASCDPGEQKL